jgi:hypothetical protein
MTRRGLGHQGGCNIHVHFVLIHLIVDSVLNLSQYSDKNTSNGFYAWTNIIEYDIDKHANVL